MTSFFAVFTIEQIKEAAAKVKARYAHLVYYESGREINLHAMQMCTHCMWCCLGLALSMDGVILLQKHTTKYLEEEEDELWEVKEFSKKKKKKVFLRKVSPIEGKGCALSHLECPMGLI